MKSPHQDSLRVTTGGTYGRRTLRRSRKTREKETKLHRKARAIPILSAGCRGSCGQSRESSQAGGTVRSRPSRAPLEEQSQLQTQVAQN